jgi:ribosomal protein L40E
MAISSGRYNSSQYHDYGGNHSQNKLGQLLSSFFSYAIEGNEKLSQLEGVKTTMDWYKEQKEFREKLNEQESNKGAAILSTVTNKMIKTLLDEVEPYYTQLIIEAIGVKTQYKEGSIETNFRIGYIPVRPYVEYVKLHNKQKISSIKLIFQLDTNTTIEKLKIHTNREGNKLIDIERISIGLELFLLEVRISSAYISLPINSFNGKLKLAKKEFKISNFSFPYLRRSEQKSVKTIAPMSILASRTIAQGKNENIVCKNCSNMNPIESKFCNKCGSIIP